MPADATTWFVQETHHPTETVRRIERACAELGKPVHPLPILPGSPQMPEIDATFPFVFYGYATLLQNAFRHPFWRAGVFFDPDRFRPSVYQEHWGERLFNTYRFAAPPDLDRHWQAHPERSYFVKPDNDLKAFTGRVMTQAEYEEWYANHEEAVGALAFCPVQSLPSAEFRIVLVDGHAIAASSYRPDTTLPVPPQVLAFAEETSRIWQPAPIYVLDIARDSASGDLNIMEANCFNGSSLYQADVREVVRQVSRYQEIQAL